MMMTGSDFIASQPRGAGGCRCSGGSPRSITHSPWGYLALRREARRKPPRNQHQAVVVTSPVEYPAHGHLKPKQEPGPQIRFFVHNLPLFGAFEPGHIEHSFAHRTASGSVTMPQRDQPTSQSLGR